MDGPEPQDEQGLRAATRNWRDAPLHGNEPPDGQKIGSFMRLFRQFLILQPQLAEVGFAIMMADAARGTTWCRRPELAQENSNGFTPGSPIASSVPNPGDDR